jgi:multidrug transporter EmrE-like cation transporter
MGFVSQLSKFDPVKAKKCSVKHKTIFRITANTSQGLPVSFLLVGMTYTSVQALQFLSVPVYTIFKNLTIIVIAYGEVIWFGGSVAPTALLSFGLMVLSSIVAAWSDIRNVAGNYASSAPSFEVAAKLSMLNAGYAWMGLNVVCTATYILSMRKVIKRTGFTDWDSKFSARIAKIMYKKHRLTDNSASNVLQQLTQHSNSCYWLDSV